jgi:hypothetical protein
MAGIFGFDPTPGFSATNVLKTQVDNLAGRQVPGYNTGYGGVSGTTSGGAAGINLSTGQPVGVSLGSLNVPQPTANKGTAPSTPGAVLGASYAPTDASQYNYYTDLANGDISNLDRQFGLQQGAVNSQYQTKLNEYNSAKAAADQGLQQGLTQARQNFTTDQNRINQNALQERQSLLRQLGILGAGGGSVARFALPTILGQQTNQALSGAGQNFAQNAQQANTAYNNYIDTQYQPGLQQLEDFKKNNLNQEQADYNRLHGGLLNVLRGLQNRSDTASNLAGTLQSYEAQIPNTITPAQNYTGTIAPYTAPSLNHFEQQVLPQAQVQSAGQQQTPATYLALLTGQNQKKQANQLV